LVKIVIFVTMKALDISVIISTYNQPLWLQKVLWSYEQQNFKNFEVVIADDGSKDETRFLIERMKSEVSYPIQYIWHEDNGFQKTIILNKATIASKSKYLLYTDGDCIARQDFVATHLKLKKENHFLSGGYFKLNKTISNVLSKEDIIAQNCFNLDWLAQHGLKKTFRANKLTASGIKAWFLNTFTTTKATFDGMNVSGWKKDMLEVNGFDERMQYGGEDREIGERLINSGIKFLQIRYSAICVHMHHERPYKNREAKNINDQIRKETKPKLLY